MKLGYSVFAAVAIAASASTAFASDKLYVDAGTVREVQQVLRDRGFRVGVDGIMGPRTQAAVRQFQKSENLDPSGRLNRQTLVALGVQESASAGKTEQAQYSREIVRSVQRTLNNRGVQAGPANGVMSPQTRGALKEFQKSENLQETGQLNPGTLTALGIAPESAAAGERAAVSAATVRQLQQRLNDRGFHAGPADGRMGPSTRAAIREFQRSQNLQVTGRLDGKTMSALGIPEPVAARR
jgi:peptidoglycan hydrolase-like protein with peptidoglycan-binding domain